MTNCFSISDLATEKVRSSYVNASPQQALTRIHDEFCAVGAITRAADCYASIHNANCSCPEDHIDPDDFESALDDAISEECDRLLSLIAVSEEHEEAQQSLLDNSSWRDYAADAMAAIAEEAARLGEATDAEIDDCDSQTQIHISSRTDLQTYVDSRLGSEATEEDIELVTNTIQGMEHPAWGDNWAPFLAEIDFWELVPKSDESEDSPLRHITIFVDNVEAGSGFVRIDQDGGHHVEDCGAQFCEDTDESDAVYELIDEALTSGKSSIKATLDSGDTLSISWMLGE